MAEVKQKKSMDAKALQAKVNDLVKLYNLDLATPQAQADKKEVEKNLVAEIKAELEKHS